LIFLALGSYALDVHFKTRDKRIEISTPSTSFDVDLSKTLQGKDLETILRTLKLEQSILEET
jgi:hypothetical protein